VKMTYHQPSWPNPLVLNQANTKILTLTAMALFPHQLTASGHFKPGSSGHMSPGHETVYPTRHCSFCRALDKVFIDMISFSIVYVACQVDN
jgi:hypothetical protein